MDLKELESGVDPSTHWYYQSKKIPLIRFVKKIAAQVEKKEMKVSDIKEQTVTENLCTSGIPDPELLIRTSGEYRISNYLYSLLLVFLLFSHKFEGIFTILRVL